MTADISHLSWPPSSHNAAAWQAACTTSGGGDLGAADDGPDEGWCSDWDADRRADAEENRRWRSLP